MIRFGIILTVVVTAIGLLIAGVLTSSLQLVYLAIGVSGLAAVMLIAGVIIWREEVFGPAAGGKAARVRPQRGRAGQQQPAASLSPPAPAVPLAPAGSPGEAAASTAAAAGPGPASPSPAGPAPVRPLPVSPLPGSPAPATAAPGPVGPGRTGPGRTAPPASPSPAPGPRPVPAEWVPAAAAAAGPPAPPAAAPETSVGWRPVRSGDRAREQAPAAAGPGRTAAGNDAPATSLATPAARQAAAAKIRREDTVSPAAAGPPSRPATPAAWPVPPAAGQGLGSPDLASPDLGSASSPGPGREPAQPAASAPPGAPPRPGAPLPRRVPQTAPSAKPGSSSSSSLFTRTFPDPPSSTRQGSAPPSRRGSRPPGAAPPAAVPSAAAPPAGPPSPVTGQGPGAPGSAGPGPAGPGREPVRPAASTTPPAPPGAPPPEQGPEKARPATSGGTRHRHGPRLTGLRPPRRPRDVRTPCCPRPGCPHPA